MKRVLIVDDDQDVREVLAELFEESYRVLLASNGVDALEILEREHADVVVLDLMMPIMDGETVVKELRAREHNVPVVVLSASRDLARRAQMLGVRGYCTKPCSADEILAEVARAIRDPSGGNEQGSGGPAPPAPPAPPSSALKVSPLDVATSSSPCAAVSWPAGSRPLDDGRRATAPSVEVRDLLADGGRGTKRALGTLVSSAPSALLCLP